MNEVKRAERAGWQPLSSRKRPEPRERITHGGRLLEVELEGVEAQRIRVTGEEEDSNGERGSGGARHELKAIANEGPRKRAADSEQEMRMEKVAPALPRERPPG
jgi:hypothetical protein